MTGVSPQKSRGTAGWVFSLALTLAVFVTYAPVWKAGFIWDDDAHLTSNAGVVGPEGFSAIWTSSAGVYYPLVLTTFRLMHAVWGLDPLPYHLLNVLFHAANALLLWRVLLALGVRGARWGAALWALHPVMVQSVAWVTEMKNTQSGFFYLLAILAFLHFHRAGRWWQFAGSLGFFVLAVTSKTSTVMLPVVLLLCVWWLDGRWRWRNLVLLAPFFLLSAAASAWTIWEQKFHSGALGEEWSLSFAQKAMVAGRDLWFYLGKLVWPHPLIFIYPRWNIGANSLGAYLPAMGAAILMVALALRHRGAARPFAFATAYFVVSLFPVLGFFSVYFFRFSFVSDHFQYLASMGPLALGGAGLSRLQARLDRVNSRLSPALALIFPILAVLSMRQSTMYTEGETLYRTTLAKNPTSFLIQINLGSLLLQKKHPEEALAYFQTALKLRPDYPEALVNMGQAYFQMGEVEKAVEYYQKTLKADPKSSTAFYNLGEAFFQNGDMDRAINSYRSALTMQPRFPEAHNNLGNALLHDGRMLEAIIEYRAALAINPNYAEAHHNLAGALGQTGEAKDALVHYQRAAALNPDFLPTLNALAWILATSRDAALRDGAQAVVFARRANQLTGDRDPVALGTLAAAYAEAGNFELALQTALNGTVAAKNAGKAELAATLEKHAELYRTGQPLRAGP